MSVPAAGLSVSTTIPGNADDVSAFVAALRRKFDDRITGELQLPAQAARYAQFPPDLEPRLVTALQGRGIEQLYAHQRQAWDCIRAGRSTVIVTPTASGKTLCYNLPVLQAVLTEQAKALYLFPTKALAQDQVAELHALNRQADLGLRASTFDGDTPGDARRAVRMHGDIVVSNPDMLHQGILPHHTKWAQFFERLRYVVIDELHTYRGVFGSHMANVLRRLQRICAFYGVQPCYILCSATIANPVELAEQLLGGPVAAVTESGAPHGPRVLLFWNPPVVNQALGLRASSRSQVARLARSAVKRGLQTLVFANSRLMVEVLTKYLKDVFDSDPRKAPRINAYRGGYLPNERRATERGLREGKLACVVTTNALELGVDIGALDVCLLNGYPGSIAATWQRLGRAGRRQRAALGVMVASSNPLDQYIVRNPDFFLGGSPEHARIAPDQLLILMDHIRCAAFELPFSEGERFGNEPLAELLDYLIDQGVLHKEKATWHWIADSYPAGNVSLRSVADGNFLVVDRTGGQQRIIAEVDYASAPMTIYEGAIYMVQAQPWQVEQLDWEGRKAFVTRTHADYYTEAIDYTRLKVLEEFESSASATARCTRGETHVVRHIAGYKKIRYYSHENIGYDRIELPDLEMHTTAVWWQVQEQVLQATFRSRWEALDGFLGAAHALHHVAAFMALSERSDLGRSIGDGDQAWTAVIGPDGRGKLQGLGTALAQTELPEHEFQPTIYLYDNYPGGIGLATLLFDKRQEVVAHAHGLIVACGCRDGCPACVGPVLASAEDGRGSPKQSAVQVLTLLR